MKKGGNKSRDGGKEREREGGREEGGGRGWWGREQGEGEEGREGESKGREEAMMLGRQRASVGEWRVGEGWLIKLTSEEGRDEAWTAGGREEASGGGIELGRAGAREGKFKGCILRRAVQLKNSEQV